MLALSLWLLPERQQATALPSAEDMVLLTDEAELEFYEDLDFYLWLDSEKRVG